MVVEKKPAISTAQKTYDLHFTKNNERNRRTIAFYINGNSVRFCLTRIQ